MRTVFVKIAGVQDASHLARMLIDKSQWFCCEPQPEDEYIFTVKEENRDLVNDMLVTIRRKEGA